VSTISHHHQMSGHTNINIITKLTKNSVSENLH